jgi:hypothetical protein
MEVEDPTPYPQEDQFTLWAYPCFGPPTMHRRTSVSTTGQPQLSTSPTSMGPPPQFLNRSYTQPHINDGVHRHGNMGMTSHRPSHPQLSHAIHAYAHSSTAPAPADPYTDLGLVRPPAALPANSPNTSPALFALALVPSAPRTYHESHYAHARTPLWPTAPFELGPARYDALWDRAAPTWPTTLWLWRCNGRGRVWRAQAEYLPYHWGCGGFGGGCDDAGCGALADGCILVWKVPLRCGGAQEDDWDWHTIYANHL